MSRSKAPSRLALFALCASALILSQCGKDKSTGGPGPGKTDPPAGGTETSTLFGRVLDEAGAPLSGVAISAGARSAETDANGIFLLPDATVPKGRAVILARKTGYFDGARAEPTGAGGRTRLELRLLKKEFSASFPADGGGTVKPADGARIEFPAGGIVTASGAPYAGTVKVAARYLSPDSGTFYDYFSGDNQGWSAAGEFAGLVSLGVLRVDMQGEAGQELRLADGKPATLTYPQPKDASSRASIPLWYFDASIGQWREEGEAALKDGAYSGTVAHFSDWNLDYHLGRTWEFCVSVTCGGKPVPGAKVRTYQHIGVSDSSGSLCFINAPADEPTATIEILSKDNAGAASLSKPAVIEVDTKSPDRKTFEVELDGGCPALIHGVVTGCGGDSVAAMVSAAVPGGVAYAYAKKGGFDIALPADTALELHVVAGDGSALAKPLALKALDPGEARDLGAIAVCSTGTRSYADILIDSTDKIDSWGSSPDGAILAARGTQMGTLLLLDAFSGSVLGKLPMAQSAGLSFSGDAKRMLVQWANGDSAEVWDLGKTPYSRLCVLRPVGHAEIADDGKTVFASSRTGTVSKAGIFSAETGTEIQTLHPKDFVSPASLPGLHPVKWLPEDDAFAYLVAKAGLGTARVWSISGDSLIREFATGLRVDELSEYYIGFSPSGRHFQMSGGIQNITVFETLAGRKVLTFTPRDWGGQNDGRGGQSTGPNGSISDTHYFRQAILGDEKIIQRFDFRDSTLAAALPVPKAAASAQDWTRPSRDGKVLSTAVRHPYQTSKYRGGFRTYRLE